MDVNEVFITCADKWAKDGVDDRISDAIDKFEEWANNFDKNEREIWQKYYRNLNIILEIL